MSSSGPRPALPPRAPLLHALQVEWDAELTGGDPLGWPGYAEARAAPGWTDSVLTGRAVVDDARTDGRYVVIAGRFECLGGSMGAVHGERVVRAYRRAIIERLPVIVLAASGGARLQEGMVALTQMARTATAARAHASAGLLSASVLRAPSTGGVLASYASLSDLRAAQPGATIGFAGPRVVELVTGIAPGRDSHTAEAAYENGLVDALVPADSQAAWVETALGLREARLPTRPFSWAPPAEGDDPWALVQAARARSRPSGIDYAARLCESWVDLHGADPTIRAGLGLVGGQRVVVVANDRHSGSGHPGPAGFRLAQRAIALAHRLGLPLITLVDTPGADPSPDAEAGGVAAEIARTFAAMAELRTPSVGICVGEGGSGGALALAATDRMLICEHAVFSVISPEGAAVILTRDTGQAPAMARALRLTPRDLLALGIVDEIVPDDPDAVTGALRRALAEAAPGMRTRRLDQASWQWIR